MNRGMGLGCQYYGMVLGEVFYNVGYEYVYFEEDYFVGVGGVGGYCFCCIIGGG